jgi:hypothetical protein
MHNRSAFQLAGAMPKPAKSWMGHEAPCCSSRLYCYAARLYCRHGPSTPGDALVGAVPALNSSPRGRALVSTTETLETVAHAVCAVAPLLTEACKHRLRPIVAAHVDGR